MRTTERILAIKLADLGDVLLCEPALRSLRQGYPEAQIDILTTPQAAEFIELLNLDLGVICFAKNDFDEPLNIRPRHLRSAIQLARQLRKARYRSVVLLHHLTTSFGARKFATLVRATGASDVFGLDNGRGNFLTGALPDPGFGTQHESEVMLAIARQAGGDEVEPGPQILSAGMPPTIALPENYLVLFPKTGLYSRAREWPEHRFADIANEVFDKFGSTSIIVGAEDAIEVGQRLTAASTSTIDLTGKTTLLELIGLIRGARLVVGADSFIGHLAAALGIPVVSIFGPSNSVSWRPWGAANESSYSPRNGASGIVVREDLPCAPCIYTGYRLGRPAGCPARTCISMVSTERVMMAIRALLDEDS